MVKLTSEDLSFYTFPEPDDINFNDISLHNSWILSDHSREIPLEGTELTLLPELALIFEVLPNPGVDIVLPALSATFLSCSSCILASLMFITCSQKFKFINHAKFVLQVQIMTTVAVNQSSKPGTK